MSNLAIIQARMSSRRLPGKVLMPLAGQPVLWWVTRAAAAIEGIDRVVVATSTDTSDDPIVAWCESHQQPYHRGSLPNVLQRFCDVIRQEQPRYVMRITADCPLLDPFLASSVLKLVTEEGYDYGVNWIPRSWPIGLDCEAMRAEHLLTAEHHSTTDEEREHVTLYLEAHPETFRTRTIPCPLPGLATERWVLDTAEDYGFLSAIAKQLGTERIPSFETILLIATALQGHVVSREK